MADRPGPSVFTIPPHRAFADALASGLIARSSGDRLALARTTVLLPNNRARRTLTDAFVRRAENGGLLLPRMIAIGDPELDDRLGAALDPADADDDSIPPAMEPLERQLILARLVQHARVAAGDPIDAPEAMRLAADLARVLDQLLVEEIAPAKLGESVAPELSEHWQSSLRILETILDQWPNILAAWGVVDLAERRNRLLDRAARRWSENPGDEMVVAAGITTSAPAVARLLRSVARLPHGLVIFPGIDLDMPVEEWDALGPHDPDPERPENTPLRSIETHPQFHLKLLLDRMGVARAEVRTWRSAGQGATSPMRTRAVANAMAPAAFTAKWQTLPPAARRLSGVRAAIFATPGEEAQAIAIALREAIEAPGRTAALVTPDRMLAHRVAAHLKRWNIAADDSAGQPLSLTAPGSFLLVLAEAAAESFAPVPLLSLLKHPLVRLGSERVEWLDGVRSLDLALRGPRPAPGIDGVTRHLASGEGRDRKIRAAAADWWRGTTRLLEPLEQATGAKTLSGVLAALRDAATSLAGDAAWAGPAGRQAADLFANLEAGAAQGPDLLRIESLPLLLRDLFDSVAIRPPQGGHPRIFIRGLLEARLTHEDLTILGGLNEGIWPSAPAPDPWLAPAVRRALGLPGLERRIGLSAHDLVSALGAPQVLITRARRDARAPTIASRFLLRLEAMTGGVTRAPGIVGWARLLDRPAAPPAYAARPAPRPPVADRPKRIAVTKLDRLKADPFAFYADAMLGLSRLDAVDADPTPAWRGTAVHAVFEAWMKDDGCDPAKLRPRARTMLAAMSAHPVLKALWEPRLMEAIDWVAFEIEAMAQAGRRPLVAEIFGETDVAGVTLYGKVDRIDRLPSGKLAIVDYKTGQPPSGKQVQGGFSMQLGLLGLIADKGGFKGIEGVSEAFEYWSMARKKEGFGHVSSPVGPKGIAAEDFTSMAAQQLTDAVEKWLQGHDPFTAKLHPEMAPYGDYDQLMRLDEWYGRADG